jgi:hypothetical protein
MILHPREQKALDVIGIELSSSDPRLAAMLGIFTRLTDLDGNPPDEDMITQAPRSLFASTSRQVSSAPHASWRRPWLVIVPMVLLLLVATVTLGLVMPRRCAPTSSRAGHPAHLRTSLSCRPFGTVRIPPHFWLR